MSETTTGPDLREQPARIVVHVSEICLGVYRGDTCEDCEDNDCEHDCHLPDGGTPSP